MTIDELNALYEATDFGNLGNYKAPTTTSNIDLTAPVVEGIPAIQPYIPPIIQNQSDGKGPTQDPTIDPMSFGNLGIKGYNQLNIAGPVKNSFTDIIGDLYNAYTNISPVHLGIKGVKKVTDFVKGIQEKREIKKAQEAAKEQAARETATATRAMAANPNVYRNAGITSGGFASQNTGTNQGFSNKSGRGRTGYGKGGIVSL